MSLKCTKCWGSNLGNHKKCNDPCIWLLPTSVLCDLWLYFVLLFRRKSFRCPIRTTWRKRSRNTAKIHRGDLLLLFVNRSPESFCPNMKNIVCFQCWWSCFWHDNVSLLLGISVRINQDGWCGCLQFSAVYCLHWVFLTPCLFILLSLISVCGSTSATSSVVSIQTALESRVSSR